MAFVQQLADDGWSVTPDVVLSGVVCMLEVD